MIARLFATARVRVVPVLLVLAACIGGEKVFAPPVATSIAANSSTALTAVAGTTVAPRPSVLVKDQRGAPMAGANVTFAITGGAGTLTGAVVPTDATGIATVGSWT